MVLGPNWDYSLGPKALQMYKISYTVYGVRDITIYKDFYRKYDKISMKIPIETVCGKKLAESTSQ